MKKGSIVEGIEIIDIGAKGKVIGKKDGQVYLTSGALPGDEVSIRIKKNKKSFKEGIVHEVTKQSSFRVDAACQHIAYCGGCSWQELDYAKQIELKEKNVQQQLRRIGGFEHIPSEPILGAKELYHYRNKLEFTFVAQRWLTPAELGQGDAVKKDEGLGFHVPGRFDWVLHIEACHLQDGLHNEMRNFIHKEGKRQLSFFNPHSKEGVLRNIVFRNNRKGEWMVLLIIQEQNEEVTALCDAFLHAFPQVKSLWLIVNTKVNDSFSDCPAVLYHGAPGITEKFLRPTGSQVEYFIGPKSFFQTNSNQAERLYQLIYNWAGLQGEECVYDLYTGTGSIALYLADRAKKVVGIEYVPEAIEDAKLNAQRNQIEHCHFFAGDMKDLLTPDFVEQHGRPDVLITDPPRAGMHEDVVKCILSITPRRIVYVSCDPATQARDLALLKTHYKILKSKAVDMFPHTSHVENVVLLELV
jgi:23S rRNA (uracil1939-C5)-methyltransferase